MRELAQRFNGDDAPVGQARAHELGRVPAGGQAGRPQVGRRLLDLGHARQRRRDDPGDEPGQLVGPGVAQGAGGPQRAAARLAQGPERARGRQRLDGVGGRAGAAGEVGERRERLAVAFCVDAIEQRVGETAHVAQPDAHRAGGRLRVPTRLRASDGAAFHRPRLQRAVAS